MPDTPNRIPANFMFSQSSLNDWETCPRRFAYKYLQRLSYPAPDTDSQLELEQHLERGDQFHHMIHQHLSGVPAEFLTTLADDITNRTDDPTLADWWRDYLTYGLQDVPAQRHAETVLTVPLAGDRLIAKFDLLAFSVGEYALIVDWKTNTNPVPRNLLERRLQTRVYRYVLTEAGAHYNGGQPLQPEQVIMRYWFANDPTGDYTFRYSRDQYKADKVYLSNLITSAANATEYPKVPESAREQVCRFCLYRTRCWNDVRAVAFADYDDDPQSDLDDTSFDIDFDQIGEIEF